NQNGLQERTELSYNGNLLASVTIKDAFGNALTSTGFTYNGTLLSTITKDGDPNSTVTLTYRVPPWPGFCGDPVYLANGVDTNNSHTGIEWIPVMSGGVALRVVVTNNKGGAT